MTTLLTGGGTRGRDALDDDVDLARDRALVTRAQGGDRTAFDDLYIRYYRRLYRFCLRRLHDSHEAEDVAQEAFARAWRALPTFGGDRRFYPWLSVIASHLCTDVLRRRNRSTPVAEFHQGNVASTEDGGEELMIAAVDSDLVAKAFTRLSDRHQRILHLREGSGWSYQRIADHEGVGITAVETLLWRARQALKREFASLAGADGRTAAWIGSVFSLATLRRLLSSPSRGFKKLSATGAKGAAVAAGSAVAATAMVISATLSSPPGGGGSSALPVSGGASGGVSLPTPSGPAAAANNTDTSAGATSGGGVSLPNLPAAPRSPSSPLGSLPGADQLGTTIDSTNSTLNGVGGSVDSTLRKVTATLSNTIDNLS
ncbi:MAG: RNA polymerase sigma factor, partial [Acidimicrobiales bacterium]